MDTARLLGQAQRGDRGALDALYVRHRGRLLTFVRSILRADPSRAVTAEDVVQEALLESARKLHEFDDRGPSSFYRWLAAIARFKVQEAERARHARKRGALPLEAEPAGALTSPSGRAGAAERERILDEALRRLPGAQAEAVRLRYLEGLPIAEAAERLGRTPAAVKSLVSRGLGALADEVSGSL